MITTASHCDLSTRDGCCRPISVAGSNFRQSRKRTIIWRAGMLIGIVISAIR
jgi:hypothetical protein